MVWVRAMERETLEYEKNSPSRDSELKVFGDAAYTTPRRAPKPRAAAHLHRHPPHLPRFPQLYPDGALSMYICVPNEWRGQA